MLWDELLNLEEAMARRGIELAVSLAFLHFYYSESLPRSNHFAKQFKENLVTS